MDGEVDRFDLEQCLMTCWQTADDIDLLVEHLLEDGEADADKIANLLVGIRELHTLRTKKAIDVFETLVHDDAFGERRAASN